MEKLKKYLDAWLDGKSVRGVFVTLEDIRTLQDAYDAIRENKAFCFLSGNVKKVLEKCGIATIEHDVGWMIVQKGEKNKQTNEERINTMSLKQKAEFLATFSVEKIVNEWCGELCPRREAGYEECNCQYSIKDSIEGWLKAEAKEEV